MAGNQKSIEILLQFKQAGEEILKQVVVDLKGTGAAATATTQAFQAFQQQGTTALKQLQSQAQSTGSSLKSTLAGIKADFGKSSISGQITRALAGGGIIAGVGLGAHEFESLTEGIKKFSTELRDSKVTVGQAFGELARGVPILGPLTKGFDNLRDAITGDSAAMAQQDAELKQAEVNYKGVQKVLQDGKKETQDWIAALQQLRRELALAFTPAAGRPSLEAYYKSQDQLEGLNAKVRAAEFDTTNVAKLPDGSSSTLTLSQALFAAAAARKSINTIQPQLDAASQIVHHDAVYGFGYARPAYDSYADPDKVPGLQQQLKDAQSAQAAYQNAADALQNNLNKAQGNFLQGANLITATGIGGDLTSLKDKFSASLGDAKKVLDGWHSEVTKNTQRTGDEIAKSLETPLEQAQTKLRNAENSFLAGGISQETLNKAQNEYTETVSKMVAEAEAAQNQMGEQVEQADERKREIQNEFADFIAANTTDEVMKVKEQYDRDLANWTKLLTDKNQLAQVTAVLERERDKKIAEVQQQALTKQVAIADQLAILQAQANNDATALGQANLKSSLDSQRDQWAQYRADGIANQKQYQDALTAIDKEGARKQLEVSGTFFEGLRLGFQELQSTMLTWAQIGNQTASEITDGFANAFVGIVSGSQKAGDAFRQMAAGILSDIARILARQAVLNLIGGIFSVFSGPGVGIGAGIAAGATAGINAGNFGAGGGGILGGSNAGIAAGQGFAVGGQVGGSGIGDTVPAWLSPGEFVVRRGAVSQPGILGLLQAINSGMGSIAHYSIGGLVDGAAGPPAGKWRGGQAGAGDAVNITALVGIGDKEIEKISSHPKFREAVRQEVFRNRSGLGISTTGGR